VQARVAMNPRLMPELTTMLDLRMGRAVHTLRNVLREKLNIPYPPASRPGQPPHKRTGGLRRSVFAKRIRKMEWALGFRKVMPDPKRPTANREWLGLWMEMGTGRFRTPFAMGTQSILPQNTGENTATTGTKTSVAPRPSLLPTVIEDGPRVLGFYLRG
jgi:hypothetical protein